MKQAKHEESSRCQTLSPAQLVFVPVTSRTLSLQQDSNASQLHSYVQHDQIRQSNFINSPNSSSPYHQNAAPPAYDLYDNTTRELLIDPDSIDGINRCNFQQSMPPGPLTRLSKPIAIPATDSQLGSPFLRAYPSELGSFGISREKFLEFLDHLNRVTVLCPPAVALGLVGGVVSLVPEPTAQITGTVVDIASTVVAAGASKVRTEMLLREANRDLFGPCQLKAQIARLDAVAKLACIPILDLAGKIRKDNTILPTFEDVHEVHLLPAQIRRVKALEPWTSPLEVEGLPPVKRDAPMSSLNKMHVMASEWQRKEEEKKLLKSRQKALDKWSQQKQKAGEKYESQAKSLAKKEAQIRQNQDLDWAQMDEELTQLQSRHEKATKEYEENLLKVDRDYEKRNKEERSMKKIYFLVLTQVDGNGHGYAYP